MFGLGTSGPGEISVQEVGRRIAAGEQLFLLDVREPEEFAEARVAGSVLIPLGELSERLGEVPQDRTVVAICRVGQRSAYAAELLRRAGLRDVLNMQGGMYAWVRSGLAWDSGEP
jgi:sulfur-carrier protein adenylyltransferase/sulfurtransferase